MTFMQLEFFIAIMESNTFLDAADKLNVSQSSLSKQIMSLEKELGVTLLDRSHRHASPTQAGRLFYEDARKLMTDYELMKNRLLPFSGAMAGHIRLGTLPILGQYKIAPILRRFAKEYTGIRLDIHEVEDEQLIYGLKHGTYDLIIARDTLLDALVFESQPLADDRLVAVLSQEHPLSGSARISLKDLAGEDFILMRSQSSIYHLSVECCVSQGFTPNVIRTARIESILGAVAAGEGVSLLCKKNFTVFNPEGIAVLEITPEIKTPVSVAHLAGQKPSRASRIFLQYLQKHYPAI